MAILGQRLSVVRHVEISSSLVCFNLYTGDSVGVQSILTRARRAALGAEVLEAQLLALSLIALGKAAHRLES